MKKILSMIFAVAIMLVVGVSAFAAVTTKTENLRIFKMGDREFNKADLTEEELAKLKSDEGLRMEKRMEVKDLTEEEIAKMKEEMEVKKAKFDNLTDEQKEELNKLEEECSKIRNQMVDKYLEFGLISEEEATNMKAEKQDMKMGLHIGGGKIMHKELSIREKVVEESK